MKATSGIEKNISTQKSLNTTSGVKRLTYKEFDNGGMLGLEDRFRSIVNRA